MLKLFGSDSNAVSDEVPELYTLTIFSNSTLDSLKYYFDNLFIYY